MIPKTIHYCWFGGGEKSEVIRKCFSSWEKQLQDYNIICWDESNFDIERAPQFVKDAYSSKKWAFVSDYVRLYVLYYYGGICLDTDVEVKHDLSDYLSNRFFIGTQNFPIDIDKNTKGRKIYLSMGVIGSEPNHPYIKECLSLLSSKQFRLSRLTATNNLMTECMKGFGYLPIDKFQVLEEGLVVYPSDVFADKLKPEDFDACITFHWGEMSWYEHRERGIFWKFCNKLRILPLYSRIERLRLKLFN